MFLKQSTAKVISFGPFVDKGDGVTLETGLVSALDHASTGILLSKNGGALTIRHASVTASTYDAYGNYLVTLDTTDTNTLGTLRVQFVEAATCLAVWRDFLVLPANVYDSLVGGTDSLDVEVASASAAGARAIMDATRTAELASVPSQTVPSYSDMLAYLYQRVRNVVTETATTEIVKKANGSTTLSSATLSDDGTTFTRGAGA
jgi:hypothetical protein